MGFSIVGDGGSSSYSAEIEQTVEQEIITVKILCSNDAEQIQDVIVIGEATGIVFC